MLRRLFRPFAAGEPPYALYTSIVEQARSPALYEEGRVPDTLDGRFDMIVLHLILVIERLRETGGTISPQGQAAFDLVLADMDRSLRELGVGDIRVPKKMKKIAESFYGRFAAYTRAADRAALAAAIDRNIFAGTAEAGGAERFADYYLRSRDALAAQPAEALIAGHVEWPALEAPPAAKGEPW
jgi:cytochrome b pre-mRNA-processing protein 3